MNSIHRFFVLAMLGTLLMVATALAQRPRSVGDPDTSTTTTTPTRATQQPAPQEVKAKYEGGVLGYRKKIDGTLFLDDQNSRLLFRDKNRREVFSISYEAITSAYADKQSKRPTATNVLGSLSIYTLPAKLIKKKFRYLTVQYNDQDTHVNATTSFKMENQEILDSVLGSLANKAGLTPRGDVYIRRKDSAADTQKTAPE
jgi:hypothetical protein